MLQSESQVARLDVSILTRSPMFNVGARGNSVHQLEEHFENFPEYIRVNEACDDARKNVGFLLDNDCNNS